MYFFTHSTIRYREMGTHIMNVEELSDIKGQKLLFFNVRSLFPRIHEMQMIFGNSNYICIGLSETWLMPLVKDSMIQINGFDTVRLDRSLNKRGGGVLLFVRSDVLQVPSIVLPSFSNPNIEALSIVLKRPYQKLLCVSVIYIPPTSNLSETFVHLDNLAERVTEHGMEWVIGGDFNINLLSSGDNRKKGFIKDFTTRNSLFQQIETATRVTLDSSSLLDHIYVNTPDKIKEAGVLSYSLSDHQATYIIIKKNLEKKIKTTFWCRNTKFYHITGIKTLLERCCWAEFLATDNPEIKWQIMLNHFIDSVNQIAPWTELRNVPEKEPWVTTEILKLIRDRDVAQQEFLDLKGSIDRETLRRKLLLFHELRNKAKREVMRAKRNYVRNTVNLLDTSSKKFWQELHKIAPIGKKAQDTSFNSTISLSNDNDELIRGDDASTVMNDFFISVGEDLASKITIDNQSYKNSMEVEPLLTMETWDRVSKAETLLLVQGLDIQKNSNIEQLNIILLKDCLLSSIDKLTQLFNSILLTNVYPDAWKLGTVVPLFKSGNRQKANNY